MDFLYSKACLLLIGIFYSITLCLAECPSDRTKDWSYDNNLPNGPIHWGEMYSDCNGDHQSPINIETSNVVRDGNSRLQVENYDQPVTQVRITNDGYKINVIPIDDVQRTLSYNDKQYTLKKVHFHVGSSSNKGSEHEINGNKYSMEVHFVHKSDDGDSLTLASFLEESSEKNPTMDVILSVSSAYEYEGEKFEGSVSFSNSDNPGTYSIYLEDLIQVGGSYYHYSGSLEFPPCTENKEWLIMRSNKEVSSSQLRQLFGLYRAKRNASHLSQCHLINNYRPVQPLNDRTVYG